MMVMFSTQTDLEKINMRSESEFNAGELSSGKKLGQLLFSAISCTTNTNTTEWEASRKVKSTNFVTNLMTGRGH